MNKIVSAIFALYVASFFYMAVPFVKTLTILGGASNQLFWNHLAIFVIFFLAAFLVLLKLVVANDGGLQLALGSLALLGLIIALLYHVIPIASVYKLPTFLNPYFASDTAFTAWLIAPLVVLFF